MDDEVSNEISSSAAWLLYGCTGAPERGGGSCRRSCRRSRPRRQHCRPREAPGRHQSSSCRRRCPRVSASRSTVDKSYFSKASGRCGPLPPPHIPCTPAQTRAAARPGSRQPIASCTLNPAVDARTCDYMTMNWQLSSAAHAGRTARMEALAVDCSRSYVCVCCMRLLLEC